MAKKNITAVSERQRRGGLLGENYYIGADFDKILDSGREGATELTLKQFLDSYLKFMGENNFVIFSEEEPKNTHAKIWVEIPALPAVVSLEPKYQLQLAGANFFDYDLEKHTCEIVDGFELDKTSIQRQDANSYINFTEGVSIETGVTDSNSNSLYLVAFFLCGGDVRMREDDSSLVDFQKEVEGTYIQIPSIFNSLKINTIPDSLTLPQELNGDRRYFYYLAAGKNSSIINGLHKLWYDNGAEVEEVFINISA